MTKRRILEKELKDAGFKQDTRFRGGHDKFVKGSKSIVIPRHKEIPDQLANAIRKEAGLK